MGGRGSWSEGMTAEERRAHMARIGSMRGDPARKLRARITNKGAVVVAKGNTVWGRRYRDLVEAYEADMGGYDGCSAGERALIRRIASLQAELERYDRLFATNEEATMEELALYGSTADRLRRLLEAIGIQRRPRDVTPTLDSIAEELDLRDRHTEAAE